MSDAIRIEATPYYQGAAQAWFVHLGVTGMGPLVYGPIPNAEWAERLASDLVEHYKAMGERIIKEQLQ